MKKAYDNPELILTKFSICDVITYSIPGFDSEGIEDYGDSGGI